ncbi:HNH endonuclease [Cellulomonas edaphi]|uniref:HNH endonuclease n=1 Tax=Cellulomonas edaphi TaxID=3053468 RepID=A0ABT7SA31_9CELL|nr:HNH endonuclease [Cellulomons edaphi]MDM7832486.1 HNH endonuclease [Cellulomons edaphi]
MAAGDDRGHGGNVGYDDQVDAYYSWDSNVPNHKNLAVGDPIALWDKQRLLGISAIEAIESSPGTKLLSRCPECGTTRIGSRKNSVPQFRCMKCRHEFATPRGDLVEVTLYTARYDAAWTSLEGVLNEREVRSLAVNSREFNAMRPLDWAALRQALLTKDADRAVARVTARADLSWHSPSDAGVGLVHGFGRALVRVRRGQQQFRSSLLATQGSVCAFTGAAPPRVLEAGHLYSYAQVGTHHKHGGLMLRRDIHRLFDDGMLAVEPAKLRIDVAQPLAAYPQYARLHGERLTLRLQDEQVDWLGKHWDEHRAAGGQRIFG